MRAPFPGYVHLLQHQGDTQSPTQPFNIVSIGIGIGAPEAVVQMSSVQVNPQAFLCPHQQLEQTYGVRPSRDTDNHGAAGWQQMEAPHVAEYPALQGYLRPR
jgi:hypothetical protein